MLAHNQECCAIISASFPITSAPAHTGRSTIVVLMLEQRLQRWPKKDPTLAQYP